MFSILAKDRRRFAEANAYGKNIGSKEQVIAVTDLICEGPIEGLADSASSVYLDGDPIFDAASEATFYKDNVTISVPVGASSWGTADPVGSLQPLDITDTTEENNQRFLFIFDALTSSTISGKITEVKNPRGSNSSREEITIEATTGTPYKTSYTDTKGAVTSGDFNFRLYKDTASGPVYMDYYLKSIANSGAKGTFVARYNLRFFNQADVNKTITVKADLALQCTVALDGNNKKLKVVNNHTDAFAITDKKFAITGEGASTKIKNSSVQFRTGTENQTPITSLAGVGTSSIAVNLSESDKTPFQVQGKHLSKQSGGGGANGAYWREEITTTTPYTQAFKEELNATKNARPITLQTKSVTLSSQGLATSQIAEIDEIRLQLKYISGLYHLSGNGRNFPQGAGHEYHIFFKRDGAWLYGKKECLHRQTYHFEQIKTAFTKDEKFDLSEFQPFEDICIQVTRVTPTGADNPTSKGKYEMCVPSGSGKKLWSYSKDDGSPDDNGQSAVDISALTQIVCHIKERLNYPFTAIGAVSFSSREYQSNPVRTYEIKGKLVKIPSNYTPRHLVNDGIAVYDGLWDGTFKDELTYTDNPAWTFYDMLSNDRYGLGGFLDEVDIDKFALYKIAKYCDELVSDGKGGEEPRFTSNLLIAKATDSYKVLKDMSTVFRGMLYWLDGQMLTIQDAPAAPVYNFGPSNIINGEIKTEGTGSKTRANQIVVTWNNPTSQYRLEPIIVEDRQNILETGRVIKNETQAFGCTSQGQALRYGKWKLWTSTNQKEIISFETGINASFLVPGDIINVQQSDDHGVQFSGRVSAHALVDSNANSQVTLDRNIAIESGGVQADGGGEDRATYTFSATSTYTLSTMVNTRKVVLAQDSTTINGTTYSRGDEIQTAWLPTGSNNAYQSATINLDQLDDDVRTDIASARAAQAGPAILLQLVNSQALETRPFTSSNVSVVGGKTVIKCTGKFTGDVIVSDSIWAIKEVKEAATLEYSYKEYKILSINEEDSGNISLTAVEFYNTKFDAVDREFELDTPDTLYTTETLTCPAPANTYVLQTPLESMIDNEVIIHWDKPLNDDGTVYEYVTGYEVEFSPPHTGNSFQEVNGGDVTSISMRGIPSGLYRVGVRAVTTERKSRFTYSEVDLQDIYGTWSGPRVLGAALGVNTDFEDVVISGSKLSLLAKDWTMKSVADTDVIGLTNSNTSTTHTYEQELGAMAYSNSDFPALSRAYVMFDRNNDDTSTDHMRLMAITPTVFENTTLETWYDVDTFAPTNSGGVDNNRWVHTACNVSVSATTKTNRVVRTGGTGFTSLFELGDTIRLKSGTKFYAATIVCIHNDDLMFTDIQLNNTDTDFAITANSTDKTVARQAFRLDTRKDGILAKIERDGSDYSDVTPYITVLPGIRGRTVVPDIDVGTLNYAADSTLSTTWGNEGITLTARALNYVDPVFKVTGNFASNSNADSSTTPTKGQADTAFTAGTNGVYTKVIHNQSSANNPIAYTDPSSGSPQEFTVAVRESQDSGNATLETSTTVSLGKIRQGLQGASAGVFYLYCVQNSIPTGSTTVKDPNQNTSFPTVRGMLSTTGGEEAGTLNSSYNITSGQVMISGAGSGWYTTPQATTTNANKQWVIVASGNGTGDYDDILRGEWTTPTQFSGADGLAGLSVVLISLYKATSSNSSPSSAMPGASTWAFDSSTFSSGPANSWTLASPEISSSNTHIWKTTAAAKATTLASGTSADIAANDWSTPVLVAQKASDGPAGVSTNAVNGYLYFQTPSENTPTSNNTPTYGTNPYNFSTGVFTTTNSGHWKQEPPVFEAGTINNYWYRTFTISQTGSANQVVTIGNITKGVGFTNLVTFTNLSDASDTSTTIDGSKITTGIIKSSGADVGVVDGSDFPSQGMYINLANGAIGSKNLRIESDGDVEIKGTVNAESGYIGSGNYVWSIRNQHINGGGTHWDPTNARAAGDSSASWANITLDSYMQRILIRDSETGSNDDEAPNIRVILGWLGSTVPS